jgi:hypothetical protein
MEPLLDKNLRGLRLTHDVAYDDRPQQKSSPQAQRISQSKPGESKFLNRHNKYEQINPYLVSGCSWPSRRLQHLIEAPLIPGIRNAG